MYPSDPAFEREMERAARFKRRVKNTQTGQRGFLIAWPPQADQCKVVVEYREDAQHDFVPQFREWPKETVRLSETRLSAGM